MRWSIIVCTYNRAQGLAETLNKLKGINYPKCDFEILVVDNASTDETTQVIRKAAAESPNLMSVREEAAGLSHARNRGIETARGEFIAFLDDDAWPEADWLSALDEGFQQEGVMCVGGKVVPAWPEGAPPPWIPERLYGFFSLVDYGARRLLHYPDYPAGTNIAFRKEIFDYLPGFSATLGRIGECLLSMEEAEICLRIEEAGFKVAYRDDAVVHHSIQSHRLTQSWLLERANWQGISAAVIEMEKFGRIKNTSKILKYSLFLAAGVAGSTILSTLPDKKPAFFCSFQTVLCKAYIRKIFSPRN